MKRVLGITFGGLQKRTTFLVLLMLALTVAVLSAVSAYQNRMLIKIVGETRTEQQRAISETAQASVSHILEDTLVNATSLQARIADKDFSMVVSDINMLQTMAKMLFENDDTMPPARVSPPDPAKDGTASAMVLCEEGVDYTQSELLGTAAHLSDPMIAMFRNSDKIDGCYIGLVDGTFLCVDDKAASKYDADGNLLCFPVRERPWYRGAIESGGLYFTGIMRDAFSGRLLVTCSAPVEAEGEIVGVVGVDIVLKSMNDFITSTAGSGSTAYIVNDKGQVLLASDRDAIFKTETFDRAQDLRDSDNAALAQFIKGALSEKTELTAITLGDRLYYMAGAPMPTVGWAVISAVDKELTERPEHRMMEQYEEINANASAQFRAGTARTQRTSVIMLSVVCLIGVIAALFATHVMVGPIEEMTRSIVRSSRTGELFEMKDVYRTNDEIEVLAESFADLSKKTKLYIEEITEITKEKERIITELALGKRLQESMLPHEFPPFPDRKEFDLYAVMDPAREVGGDFYDFFLIDEDHLGLIIADVSGKGIPAALFMMICKTILQSCAMLGKSAAETLTKTNEAICSNNQVEMFVTVWFGILEISTGKLTASNAGHEYPALKRPDGSFELLKDKHGLVIGAMEDIRYKEYELQLEPGSKLFVYTDGVPEATDADNNMFGTQRMLDALNEQPDASPEQLLANVKNAVDGFVQDAEQFDDLTMLCIDFRGQASV